MTDTAPAVPAKPKTDWAAEARSIFWLLLAVLGFHSLIAKPFYIPSESMMPGLLTGDRLVVAKYPYGWSYVSPSFHVLPFMHGRLLGRLPKRGDVVIIVPPGKTEDLIKRVIGLPGETIEVRQGVVFLNGKPVRRSAPRPRAIPVDANSPCADIRYLPYRGRDAAGHESCNLPVVRETLPGGCSYDTIDLGFFPDVDDYGPVRIPAGHVFVMGDNRDNSADSRVPLASNGLGGPVPVENLGGRAEFITFSLNGGLEWWNPISWITSLRAGRSGTSLRPAEAK